MVDASAFGRVPLFEDLAPEELDWLAAEAEERTYAAGEWLFRQSSLPEWSGVVAAGEVEWVEERSGQALRRGLALPGTPLAEHLWLDALPHARGALTRAGATVVQLSAEAMASLRAAQPDVYYRVAARAAQHLAERWHGPRPRARDGGAAGTRREHDLLGTREIPAAAYYGIQTLRAVENFPLSGMRVGRFRSLVEALAYVKKACALANRELGVLDERRAAAIAAACDEILAGRLHDQFIVDMVQGGAGTSTNMNANEVIANRALELLGHERGTYEALHPNDHVNLSQSTNDVYPTAVKLALTFTLRDTVVAMRELCAALEDRGRAFADVLKMGRTENQDAVPMTLGQEFSAYAQMLGQAVDRLEDAATLLTEINLGATAIGTGINAPPGYAELAARRLAEVSGVPVVTAPDLVEATQDAGAFIQLSAALKRAAVQISKICNDLRWLSSGPRCGLNEIELPPLQPGSSIMPGKVNPVLPEAVNQVCFQIVGYDVSITLAAEAGELELNAFEPLMAFDLLQGLVLLRQACRTLAGRCVSGITANQARCRSFVESSIGLVTALNPAIGYERSVQLAREALQTGRSVYELVLEKGWLTREAVDALLRPEEMIHPRRVPTA